MWIIVVILVLIITYYSLKNDKNKVAIENLSNGGFHKTFNTISQHLENHFNMVLINDNGRSFTYSTKVIDNLGGNGHLLIGIMLDFDKPLLYSKYIDSRQNEFKGMNVGPINSIDLVLFENSIRISLKPILNKFTFEDGNFKDKKELPKIKEKEIHKIKIETPIIKNEDLAIEVYNSISKNPKKQAELDFIKKTVNDIISKDIYISQYIGNDLVNNRIEKPTNADNIKYELIIEKLGNIKNPKLHEIINKPSDFYIDVINLNFDEVESLKKLNKKIGDWMSLQGTTCPDGMTLADKFDLIEKLEKELE